MNIESPDVPLDPLLPDVPAVPEEPDVPLEPDNPELPEVPLVPELLPTATPTCLKTTITEGEAGLVGDVCADIAVNCMCA